jgi:hypothetical protein
MLFPPTSRPLIYAYSRKRLTKGRIPFDRALALANQEKITEKLYPLFVHNIGALLYHPINLSRPPPLPHAFSREELPPLQYADDPDRRPKF